VVVTSQLFQFVIVAGVEPIFQFVNPIFFNLLEYISTLWLLPASVAVTHWLIKRVFFDWWDSRLLEVEKIIFVFADGSNFG
jgi:hypothetical protein